MDPNQVTEIQLKTLALKLSLTFEQLASKVPNRNDHSKKKVNRVKNALFSNIFLLMGHLLFWMGTRAHRSPCHID